jgi:hypothetical protein
MTTLSMRREKIFSAGDAAAQHSCHGSSMARHVDLLKLAYLRNFKLPA